jgi:hypothetical protein
MSHRCPICYKEFQSTEALTEHKAYKHPEQDNAPRKPKYWVWIVVGISILAFLWWSFGSILAGGQYDEFAQCIANSGAQFYGAFWCPHCSEQKELFGASAKHLPYIECSTPDGQGQLAVCSAAGINSYPTWIFTDGTRGAVMSLQELSQKTNCPLA